MRDIILLFVAFLSGVLLQRIYIARFKGLFTLGKSWRFTKNRTYRLLHRVYCELCPRRLYCKEYLERFGGKATGRMEDLRNY